MAAPGPPPGSLPPAGAAGGLAPEHLVAPAVTLVLGCLVAAGTYFTASDLPSEILGDRVIPSALLLVAVVAPVALLLAWGEVDLSAFGALPFAGYLYSEASDAGVAVGLLAAAGACLVIGLCVGFLRWATRAPSALITLASGLVLSSVAFRLLGTEGPRLIDEAITPGAGLPFAAAFVFTALTVVVAVALGRGADAAASGSGGAAAANACDPRVIVGYGLSGAAVGTYGAMLAGLTRSVVPSDGSMMLLLVFCAIAIGGVVRGNYLIGPITAAIGAVATQLMLDAGTVRSWDFFDTRVLIACVLAVCLLVAHALHRLLAPTLTPR